jgi:hypothetical protein
MEFPLSSSTQRLAGRVADAIARNRPLTRNAAFDAFLAGPADEIYALLGAFEHHLAAGTERTHDLAEAYLHLLEMRLEHLRFDIDANYEWATEAVNAFQRAVVEHVRTGRLDGTGLAMVGRALRAAKLKPIPELIAAGGAEMKELANESAASLPLEIERLMGALVEMSENDPFLMAETMAQGGFTLPPEATGAAAIMLLGRREPAAQEAAALTIMDPNAESRRAVALALQAQARRLSPVSLRRLIMLRNWLPENEHHFIDQVVRTARAAGVECAAYAPAQSMTIQSYGCDGAGAEGFLIVTPDGKRWRVSSVLVKRTTGIQDAWRGEPEHKNALRRRLGAVEPALASTVVSRAYLDLAVRHHLAIGREAGALPPLGLLEVAETVGGADWQPDKLDWRAALDALVGAIPADERKPSAVADALARSGAWGEVGVSDSWFEDDQEVADLVARARVRNLDRLAEYLLRTVLTRRAAKWAEHFTWTSLWLRHALPVEDARWRNFALLARAVAEGREIGDIPIMQDIAARSAAVQDMGRAAKKGR